MRKVVLHLAATLDGCIARPDGSVDFLFMPRGFSMADFFASIDTAILGRKTYDVAMAMGGSDHFYPSIKWYVLSRSLPAGERERVIFTAESPASLVSRIRQDQGKDIWLMGGGEVARDFLKEDLVDELQIGIVPVLLGEGIPLFPGGFPQRDFELAENETYPRGFIMLKYQRARNTAKKQNKANKSGAKKPGRVKKSGARKRA